MDRNIRLRAAWSDMKWSGSMLLLFIIVGIIFEVTGAAGNQTVGLWILTVITLILNLFILIKRYRNGPFTYKAGTFTITITDEKNYTSPEDILEVAEDLEKRWLDHKDTRALPIKVWQSYYITIIDVDTLPENMGMHSNPNRVIILNKFNANTLSWE